MLFYGVKPSIFAYQIQRFCDKETHIVFKIDSFFSSRYFQRYTKITENTCARHLLWYLMHHKDVRMWGCDGLEMMKNLNNMANVQSQSTTSLIVLKWREKEKELGPKSFSVNVTTENSILFKISRIIYI